MSGTRLLRLRVNERLEAAVEEIFGLVEKTIEEYEEGAVRSKREILQLKQQIEQLTVLKPEVVLLRADTQLVSKKRPPSLQQYEIKVEEIPILDEMKIQEHPQVKEEPVERCISPDMEADTSNNVEVKKEVNHLKQHIELLAVLKAEVTSFKTDTEEIFPSQQPDCLNLEEIKTQIKEEPVERCISPDMEADASNEDEVGHPDSEPDTNCELLPPSIDVEWNGIDGSLSARQSRSAALEQPGREDKSCRFCGKHFRKDSFLIKHVAMSHKGHKAFKCLQCSKEFEQRYRIVLHTRIHTGEKPFSCDYCDKTFTQNSARNVHMKHHTGEKPSDDHKQQLVRHMRTHTGEKHFKKTPSTAETVSVNEGDSSSSCQSRRVKVLVGLEQPRREDKSCRFCGASFVKDSFLVRHVAKSHKGHRAFKCLECKKEFEHRKHVIQHARIHTGEKPFRCDFCDKAFTQNCNRLVHMRRQTGEKPCLCRKCGKRFPSRNHLLLCVGTQRKGTAQHVAELCS